MQLRKLLKEISDHNILLEVKGGKLQVFANETSVDPALIGKIKLYQQELVAFLSGNDQHVSDNYFTAGIPVVPVQYDYALSSAQRRLWVLSQTTGASVAYTMGRAYIFEGELNEAALTDALRKLIERHESLRTVFRENEQGEIRQYIYEPGAIALPLTIVELQNTTAADARVKELVQGEMTRPFDLAMGPLVRAGLFRMAEHKWVFTYTMHHIIGDGWSMVVLIRELLSLYNAYINEDASPLSPLPVQYKDYAAWQLQQLHDDSIQDHKAYWFKQFEGELPVLELPGDKRRPAIKTYNGATVTRTMGGGVLKQLKALGLEQGATVFMTLLAAVKALLYRYTGQEDIIIGSPIAGREHIDLEDQIGFYVNVLALRSRFKGTNSFRELLNAVKAVTLDAYAHQAYPFDELVHEANLGKDTSRHALFDVVVVLQNTGDENYSTSKKIGPLTITGYEDAERVVSLFDLRFDFKEAGELLLGTIDYNSDIYNKAAIERMADHLGQFIRAVINDADAPLHSIDYLSAAEKRYLLDAFNGPAVDYPKNATIVELFEAQVAKAPHAIALISDNTPVTYNELNRRANQIAHFLINDIRLNREDGVGILLDRTPDCIAAMLGILKSGGMYIPFDTATPEERLKFMVHDTGMKVLVTSKAYLETANRLQWFERHLVAYVCVDSLQLYEEKEQEENMMMNQELWDHVGQKATDQITGGGWISSYTGQAIPAEEMEEYAQNAYLKLAGSLHGAMRVLEIGCSSGLTLCKIAPKVALYYGTDLSPVILEQTRAMAAGRGFHNVKLSRLAAHDIAAIDEKDFDLIIINSVIQHFHGHNYLRRVIKDAIGLLNAKGTIFIGDVMDIEKKEDLIADLLAFKVANKGKGYNTKTDFSADLFVARGFFEDLLADFSAISSVQVQDKLYTIENELTKFRYDVILSVDNKRDQPLKRERNRYQYSEDALLRQPVTNPALPISPGDLAYVIYTSGTTGKPKGAMIQHYNVVRLFFTGRPLFDFDQRDVWTLFHSVSFDFSVWEIYGALLFGGKLVLVSKAVAQDPLAYRNLLQNEQVTVLNQTPSAFYNLAKQEPDQEGSKLVIRYIIFGGEALSPARLQEWRDKYPQVRFINMYGITETTVHVTFKEIGAEEIALNLSNIGRPIPTLSCYVLDPFKNLLPVGLPGELYVGGEGLARGYLNREALTVLRFIEHPFRKGERLYRSGDKVRILENGEMEYMGRMDDQVKIRGYRIELAEIQHHLDQHEHVVESVVLVREDNHGQKNLVAYIVSSDELTVIELRHYLLMRLPDYMVPAYFVTVEQLPLTPNGKVNKKALPDPEGLSISTGIKYVAPQNELETSLVNVFGAVLGIGLERVGIKDNFFALGGDSIKAMRLVVQVKKQLHLPLNIGNVYKYQSVEELAGWLKAGEGEDTVSRELEQGLSRMEQIKAMIEKENEAIGVLPAHYEDVYPVSQVEYGMIYSSLLHPAEPVYYDQFLFRLHIANYAQFEEALVKMVRRHPILRTRYYVKSFSEPVKVVQPAIDLPLRYEDVRMLAGNDQVNYINRFVESDQQLRLTFDDELFWRLSVFQTGAREFSILWSFHHALLDGWSVSVFCKELTDMLAENRQHELPVLKYTYKDHCAILLGRKRSDAVERYWKETFGDYSRNKLPFNYKGVKINNAHGMEYVSRKIDDELLLRLNRLVSDHGLSFKTVCVAAHVYLLHIICSEQEVVTGIVTHERPALENSEYILGCFLNTIPMRIDLQQEQTILSLLTTVNKFLTAVKPNEIHLSEIATIIGEKTKAGNPVFDTILNFTDFHLYKDLNKHTAVTAVESNATAEMAPVNQMTNTLFDVEVGKTLDRFLVNIKYAPAYFNREHVEYALALYVHILESFTGDVNASLAELNLLTRNDLQQIVYDFNATAAPYAKEKTLQQLLEAQVTRTPEAVALRQHGIDLSYEELNRRANQVAAYLIENGIQAGDNVGLLVARSFEMIIGMFGILKAGAAYVPIDPEYPVDRQAYIMENSRVVMLVTDRDYPLLQLYACKYIPINDDRISNYSTGNPELPVSSRQLAYTIYTSGSTGRPKGVMIAHHAVVNLITWVNDEFHIGANDRLLFITSMCFDLSVYDIFGMLSAGGTVVIATQDEVREVKALKKLLIEENITFWDSVPTTMNYLVGELEADNTYFLQHSLRTVFLSGDWIPVHLPDRIKKFFPFANVISLGGATEGTVWSNYFRVNSVDPLWSSIPYGRPIKNNSFYILDDSQRPVPKGVAGELYIGGVGVANGYANDREKTAIAFRKDPFFSEWGGRMYKTGDIGRLMPDGNMEFLGRKDNQVKIRGYRVELGEIESTLCRLDVVKEAVVHVYRDANNNNQLCAYVVLAREAGVQELKNLLKTQLPDYMVPNQYMLLEALPLNSNGKINRKALPEPADDRQQDAVNNYVAPVTELEIQLEQIWKSLLHRDRMGTRDDFFEQGANSLSIGAFVNRVHRETNQQLSIREVFANPTIEGVVTILKSRSSSAFEFIKPLPLQASYPLSSYQRQLWVLSQFEERNLSYHIPGVYAFEGNLDLNAFGQSLQALIDRHEILRTVFREDEQGEVQQVILSVKDLQFGIAYNDVRGDANREETVKQLLYDQFARPFDLSNGPLIRATLIQQDKQQWVFAYTMHHIISDGWSIGILIKELLSFYNAFSKGVAQTLPPLRIQYKEFAAWQQEQLNYAGVEAHRAYWLKQLSGSLPVLEMPADRPRPAVKTFNGATITGTLSPMLTGRLNNLVRERGGTLFMGLLGIVNTLLFRYTHQEDMIIGSPVAGRDHADLENQIGFYVNTLALRSRFHAGNSFNELFEQVKQVTLEGYAHQLYPFDELVYDLGLQRDVSRGTMFDVMIILQNTAAVRGAAELEMNGLKVHGYEVSENVNSKFDLVFDFVEAGDGLHVRVEYNTDIYNKDTIMQLVSHLEQLAEAVTDHPDVPLGKLDYLTAAEKEQLLTVFNDTAVPYPKDSTITRLFEDQVLRTPDATALIFQEAYTYRKLNEMANRLAFCLRELYTINSDDTVAIKLERSQWLVVAILGVLKSGGACVVIDPEYPNERCNFIITNSQSKLLIDAAALELLMEKSALYSSYDLTPVNTPHDLTFVVYTSGSTGQPKGCMLEHIGVINHLFSKIRLLNMKEGDVICHSSAFHFVGGIWQLLAPLVTGGTVVIGTAEALKDIDQLLYLTATYKARVLEIIPSQLQEHLTAEEGIDLNHISTLILTGEKLNSQFVEKCYAGNQHLEIFNTYGQTEFSDVTTCYKIPNRQEQRNVLIGRPIQNTAHYILSPAGALCPVGVIGEICTTGDGLARGYINNPVLTNEKFVTDPFRPERRMYRTGDLGRWLPGGWLETIGRKDEQVKIRGYRVECWEIENALLQYPSIEEAVVLCLNTADNESVLVAFLMSKDILVAAAIRAHLIKMLPAYMVPTRYVQLKAFPLLENGKTNKKELAQYADLEIESGVAYVAPQTVIECRLTEIWENILQRKKIGISDNFFELGGHSLKATTLMNKIKQSFKVNINLKEIFQQATVKKLSEAIEKKQWLEASQHLPETHVDDREIIRL